MENCVDLDAVFVMRHLIWVYSIHKFSWIDRWLAILCPFNGISVILGQWGFDNERLCAMEPRSWLKRFPPIASLETRLLDCEGLIMKGCVQWNPAYDWKGSCPLWVLIWLVVLGLTALWDSISVYIGPSPRERERENRNDRREKKCPNNPHPHLLQVQ